MPSPSTSLHTKHQQEKSSGIPGGYAARRGRKPGVGNLYTGARGKLGEAPLPALARESGPCPLLKGLIKDVRTAPWAPREPDAATIPPGNRRLRDIGRDEQRPMESRLYHLRRVHGTSDAQISQILDLHPDDLDALAATYGQP